MIRFRAFSETWAINDPIPVESGRSAISIVSMTDVHVLRCRVLLATGEQPRQSLAIDVGQIDARRRGR
jgi:hypothetical protein